MDPDVISDNPAVRSIIEGTAPPAARLAAARGILPLPQKDLVEILVALAEGGDQELAAQARSTIKEQDSGELSQLFKSENVSQRVLRFYAAADEADGHLQGAIVSHRNTPPEAVLAIAERTTLTDVLDQISLNQQMMIQTPGLIEAVIANPHRSADAERRATETRHEFFEKERGAQQIISELRAQGKHAAAEFIEQAEIGDGGMSLEDAIFLAEHIEVPDAETDDSWMGLEYIEEIYEETREQRQAAFEKILGELSSEDAATGERVAMLNKVLKMSVKDRVKLAMKGDREARNILIRDPNRLVSQAVANNPRITEQEVESIASMRSISEDILRNIASNRQWSRIYSITHNLVKNPRTPIANVMTLMARMQLRDLVALTKNKNVSDAVRRHALRLSQARSGTGRG